VLQQARWTQEVLAGTNADKIPASALMGGAGAGFTEGAVLVKNNAPEQSLPATNGTPIYFPPVTEKYLVGVTHSATDSSRLIVASTGKFLVACGITVEPSTAGNDEVQISLTTSVTTNQYQTGAVPLGSYGGASMTTVLSLTAGNYVSLNATPIFYTRKEVGAYLIVYRIG